MNNMKNSIINNFEYLDLYDKETLLILLKKEYSFVSYCSGSIPTAGSLTITIDKVKALAKDLIIYKKILHKNKDITFKTNKGFLKFTK